MAPTARRSQVTDVIGTRADFVVLSFVPTPSQRNPKRFNETWLDDPRRGAPRSLQGDSRVKKTSK